MKRGFTLIELLIVITIIGILVSAIAPRYVSFTDEASIATTKNNLASLRGALNLYAGKQDGYPATTNLDSVLTTTYIQKIPMNKLTDSNTVESSCDASTGWSYGGDGTVHACCNGADVNGCSSSGANADW